MSQCRPIGLATAAAWLAAFLVLVLAGCAAPEPVRTSRRPPPSTAQKPPPIAARALNVTSDCTFRDPTGYRGAMKLHVANAEVRTFEAKLDMPSRGSCQFDLKDFQQTASLPNVVLRAQASACTVHMWEQGHRVTVAFNDCADRCSAGAYLYLWPILADARSKGCG
ncbi:MAG: hypothetical protein WBP72_13485 [Rhodocyclaceae bacterium]